jgi:hypothetical protein
VAGPEPLGEEPLHGLAEELVPAVAEEAHQLGVHVLDPAGLVDDDDRRGDGVEDGTELCGLERLGGIAGRRHGTRIDHRGVTPSSNGQDRIVHDVGTVDTRL